MRITTKKGDKGRTSLGWGGRVYKDNPRVEALGSLDELSSVLGIVKSQVTDKGTKKIFEMIQKDLLTIGAEVASKPKYVKRLKKKIGRKHVVMIEKQLKDLEKKALFKEGCFYLAGQTLLSGCTDLCRTVARKAERRLVTLRRKGIIVNSHILEYINRLSDLLYLYARMFDVRPKKAGGIK